MKRPSVAGVGGKLRAVSGALGGSELTLPILSSRYLALAEI
jgi:hypothetical protein